MNPFLPTVQDVSHFNISAIRTVSMEKKTSNACVVNKSYRTSDKKKAWAAKNRKRLSEYHKAWRAKNKEKLRIYYRKYYAANHAKRRAYLNVKTRQYRARKA